MDRFRGTETSQKQRNRLKKHFPFSKGHFSLYCDLKFLYTYDFLEFLENDDNETKGFGKARTSGNISYVFCTIAPAEAALIFQKVVAAGAKCSFC